MKAMWLNFHFDPVCLGLHAPPKEPLQDDAQDKEQTDGHLCYIYEEPSEMISPLEKFDFACSLF